MSSRHLSIARRLAALDSIARPAAERFDAGPALAARVAVLAGAFNPPTLAHLALLDAARAAARAAPPPAGIHDSRFTIHDSGLAIQGAAMLSTRNADKAVSGATLAQRVEMLLALQEGGSALAVMAVNAARLVEQGEALRESFPGVAFDFVAGFDTFERLFAPRYYGDMAAELRPFFANHRVIATNRARATMDDLAAFVATPEVRPFASRIVMAAVPEAEAAMSSTAAREAAAAGHGHGSLPAAVARYIEAHGLYRERQAGV